MIEKMPKVSNPLTIIAIFAGLAEVAMTVTVGLIDGWNQTVFVWFAAIFPLLIVGGFFGVLVLRPGLLYAPNDWADESYAYRLLQAKGEKVDFAEMVLSEVATKLDDLSSDDANALRDLKQEVESAISELRLPPDRRLRQIERYLEDSAYDEFSRTLFRDPVKGDGWLGSPVMAVLGALHDMKNGATVEELREAFPGDANRRLRMCLRPMLEDFEAQRRAYSTNGPNGKIYHFGVGEGDNDE